MEKRNTRRLTLTEFISKSNLVHKNKFDYSLVEYKNNRTKVKIICPIHGLFEQTPHNHLTGSDCKKCGSELTGIKKRTTISDFIVRANKIHKNKYGYLKSEYINANIKLIITCPLHGDFQQEPKAHITLKQGCPECFNQLRKHNAPSWTKDNWIAAAKQSNIFDGFKLYFIKCSNENETFIKVGRTYTSLNKRFSQIPYKVEVIKIVEGEGDYIFDLERRFKRLYKKHQYIPLIKFGGANECFYYNPIN